MKVSNSVVILSVSTILLLLLVVATVCAVLAAKKNVLTIDVYAAVPQHRIACVYAYYEKNKLYKENFQYFLKHALLSHVEFYIVVNGECSVRIPDAPNVHILRRENKGFDFGAFAKAIEHFPLLHTYDYVAFLNTSVRGPYGNHKDWTLPFLELLVGDVKLVGTSINIYDGETNAEYISKLLPEDATKTEHPHVQSMFFMVDKQALAYLISEEFFLYDDTLTFADVIGSKELGLSHLILKNGWNINCLLKEYQGLDYRTIKADINPTSHGGDPYFKDAYFGRTIMPKEVVFFKNARFET